MLVRTTLTTFLVVACIAGCDDTNGVEERAALRLVHAIVDAPPVDVFADADTRPLATGLAYGQASMHAGIDPGDHTLEFRVAGSDTVLAEAELHVDSKQDVITAIATGTLDASDPDRAFRVLPFLDQLAPTDETHAALRLVNASPDAPTLELGIGVGSGAAAGDQVETVVLARFADSGPDAIVVPANKMLPIAVGANGRPLTAFTTPSLMGLARLYVIAIGNVGDVPRASTGLSLLLVAPDGVVTTLRQDPTVYVLDAAADAPAVDVRAAATGHLLIGDLEFGELGSVQLAPGDYALSFARAGDDSGSALGGTNVLVLNPGERYLAIASGMVTPVGIEQRFQVGVYLEQFDLGGATLVRAIQAVPDVPLVDVSTATGTTLNTPPLFPGLRFLDASAMQGLALGMSQAVHVGIAPARSQNAVATFDVAADMTQRTFMVFAGALSPAAGEQALRLFLIETATTPWQLTSVPRSR